MRPYPAPLRAIAAALFCFVGWTGLASGRASGEILVSSGSKVAFMGDSITDQGWNHPTGYVRLVVYGLEAQKIHVTPIPAGVGGNIAHQMSDRLQRDVLDKKPDWLLLSCGINDVWHVAEHKEGFDQFQRHMTDVVDRALAAHVKVMILTTTVIGEDLSVNGNQSLVGYNAFLRDLAKQKHCLVADVDADFREALAPTSRPPGAILTADGVHLNPHGDEMVASRILKTFGLTEAQLEPLREAWRDIPDAWQLRANYDRGMGRMFLVQKVVTIRQYERLQKLAAKKRQSAEDMVGALHSDNIASFIKPRGDIDSFDAIFEKKLEGTLQPKLQAMFERQVDEMLKGK